MRLFFDLNLWPESVIASPGMDQVKWLKPMRPGDTISAAAEVVEVKVSTSKPDRGVVIMDHPCWNQNGEIDPDAALRAYGAAALISRKALHPASAGAAIPRGTRRCGIPAAPAPCMMIDLSKQRERHVRGGRRGGARSDL